MSKQKLKGGKRLEDGKRQDKTRAVVESPANVRWRKISQTNKSVKTCIESKKPRGSERRNLFDVNDLMNEPQFNKKTHNRFSCGT